MIRDEFITLALELDVTPKLYRHRTKRHLIIEAIPFGEHIMGCSPFFRHGNIRWKAQAFDTNWELINTPPLYASSTIDTQAR